MHELEYLSERDLKYFERKRDDGDSVRIIYLSPKILDELSFEDIEKMEKEAIEKTGHQVTEEELEEWLKEHKAIKESEKEENKQNEQQNEQPSGQEADKQ